MPFYRVELHSHCQGDPVDLHLGHSLTEHIDHAAKIGLDAVAVTWHRRICADPAAAAYAQQRGVLLLSGMETEVDGKHLVVLNLAEGDLPGESTWEKIRELRARQPGVFVLAPHPFYPHPTCLGHTISAHADCLDAVEWCALHADWIPGRINPNLRAARWARAHHKPMVACSDAHTLATLGRNVSTVEADECSAEAIFDAIRAGRVTFHRTSLASGSLLYQTGKAILAQPRHVGRWLAAKLGGHRDAA